MVASITFAANSGWSDSGIGERHEARAGPAGGAAGQQSRTRVVEGARDDEDLAERALVTTLRPLRKQRRDGGVVERHRAGDRRLHVAPAVPVLAPPEPDRAVSHRRRPSSARRADSVVERAQPIQPGEQLPLSIVEAVLDVRREDVAAAGGADAEGDRHRVIRLVGDRNRDPGHAELLGASRGPSVQPHRGLPGRQSLDLDVAPADSADSEPEDLAHRLLRRPAPGERLRSIANVATLGRRQDSLGEPFPEPTDRRPDPIHLDDVDPQLAGASVAGLGLPVTGMPSRPEGRAPPRVSYSTVTDFARLRGWSTSVPRATAM